MDKLKQALGEERYNQLSKEDREWMVNTLNMVNGEMSKDSILLLDKHMREHNV